MKSTLGLSLLDNLRHAAENAVRCSVGLLRDRTRHGGTIDCETERGKGTTFIVRLPIDGERQTQRASQYEELAAHEPGAVLNPGVVAKIDLAEGRSGCQYGSS